MQKQTPTWVRCSIYVHKRKRTFFMQRVLYGNFKRVIKIPTFPFHEYFQFIIFYFFFRVSLFQWKKIKFSVNVKFVEKVPLCSMEQSTCSKSTTRKLLIHYFNFFFFYSYFNFNEAVVLLKWHVYANGIVKTKNHIFKVCTKFLK